MTERGEHWAVIPARGGSKSVPFKNLHPLNGRPLIDYTITASKQSRILRRIICSTESGRIADYCRQRGAEVHQRPDFLATDETPIAEVLLNLLDDFRKREKRVPDTVALVQPTSPFLLPEHIDQCLSAIGDHPEANSSQTIIPCPHNAHAYNQRILENGRVRFRFTEERARCYNKQTKPPFYLFGNLVVFRGKAFLETGQIFMEPSVPVVIPDPYALDVDQMADFETAEWYLKSRKVDLPLP